jgi:hypothetical protein
LNGNSRGNFQAFGFHGENLLENFTASHLKFDNCTTLVKTIFVAYSFISNAYMLWLIFFFFNFVMLLLSGNCPQVYLANFGGIRNTKIYNLKHPFILLGNCGNFWVL